MGKGKTGQKPSILARLFVAATMLVIVVVGVGAALFGARYNSWTLEPVLDEGREVQVVIPHGTNWSSVVDQLEAVGVVQEPLLFDIWGRRRDLPLRVKAGSYSFRGPMSLEELDAALSAGGSFDEVQVTFPEGFTIFHMADRVQEVGLASRDDFLEAARDSVALAEAGIDGDSFEGYLFPDTYRFRKAAPPDQIVARLHKRWSEEWGRLSAAHPDAMAKLAGDFGFDRHDLVTMASIVERESSVASERPLVARVFYNRLGKGMKLQTDPTCVYGEKTYADVPSPAACKNRKSRYSTYVIEGLPPGPIANPGAGALLAALRPSEEEGAGEKLYFVAKRDGTGEHYFSATFEEHKAAIRKYLQ